MSRKARIAAFWTRYDYTPGFPPAAREYRANTLNDYLIEFGGWSGPIEDPFGRRHEISLRPFAHLPPNVYIKFRFEFLSPDRDEFAPETDGAVVLTEYEVPDDAGFL